MAVTTITIAFATLIVSICMFFVAKSSLDAAERSRLLAEQSLILSSKDFTPIFDFDVDDKTGNVLVKNQMAKLYTIVGISVYEIKERGFELDGTDSLVLFSLLTKSAHLEEYLWNISDDSVTINFNLNKSHQLASMQKCYNEAFVNRIDSYLDTYYAIDSPKGYALPSLYSIKYLVEVFYRDRMGNARTSYMVQDHVHGRGWWRQTIREDQFVLLLQHAEHKQIENMRDIDSIMAYFTENCKVSIL